jgi:hypothetical protein
MHGKIYCSEHGWQKELTKKQIEKSKRALRAARKAAERRFEDEFPF